MQEEKRQTQSRKNITQGNLQVELKNDTSDANSISKTHTATGGLQNYTFSDTQAEQCDDEMQNKNTCFLSLQKKN